jgi:formylglycine-generating enzyme required for sulfatase activity
MTVQLLVPELARLEGGSFVMGNDAGRADEQPSHTVTVAAFRAGIRPVSNAEYLAFVAATGHEPPPFVQDERFWAPAQPVVGISWHDAIAYCRWLSAQTGLRYRLPTEAEREYASRGGVEGSDWPWDDATPSADIAALDRPHVPTAACANRYGLLCMADNVHEWCSDWYDAAYYARSPAEAPSGPRSGRRRASRGGSWRHQIKFTRLSARSSLDPSYHYNDYGFRAYADA